MRLEEAVKGRDNNFNLIRLLAAFGVLVSHAWPITLGPGTVEPLERITGQALGTICVCIFFAISGLLISQSFSRSRTFEYWAVSRALRILPGLAVMLVLTAFVLGPAVTTLAFADYMRNSEVWSYVPRNLSLALLQYPLPGVFRDNPFAGPINGSLWSLWYEVLCYAGVAVVGVLGLFRRRRRILAAALLLASFLAFPLLAESLPKAIAYQLVQLSLIGLPFALGMICWLFRDRIVLSWLGAITLMVAAAMLRPTPLAYTALAVALTYATFCLAYLLDGGLRAFNRLGDYSYGVYIYAFPIQQLAVHLQGPMTPTGNILVSAPPVLLLAALSWRGVEKPALAFKSRLRRRKDTRLV